MNKDAFNYNQNYKRKTTILNFGQRIKSSIKIMLPAVAVEILASVVGFSETPKACTKNNPLMLPTVLIALLGLVLAVLLAKKIFKEKYSKAVAVIFVLISLMMGITAFMGTVSLCFGDL
jgi:uncharacterized protein YacL